MYERIAKAVFDSPWAIQPSKMEAIVALIENKMNGGESPKAGEFQTAASRPRAAKSGSVALIPVHGVIAQRMNAFSDISGGVSTELLADDIKAAVNDESVKAIVLDIHSPGGSVYGMEELADIIMAAREQKHITAIANSLAASAGYWIGSQASEFVITPSGEVGSIGVLTGHVDQSKFDAEIGVKYTYISAGKFKTEGNPHEPLSEEAIKAIEASVEPYFQSFTNAVSRGRNVDIGKVLNGFGEGRVLGAKAALAEGMVDRIATLDQVLEKLGVQRPTNTRRSRVNQI